MGRKLLRIPEFFNESVEEFCPIDVATDPCEGGQSLNGGKMAAIGRTLVRLAGALMLAASATAIDHPGTLEAPWLSSRSRIATVPVLVAARDLPEGVVVDPAAVVVAGWPVGTQPAGAFTTIESVATRVTRVPVYKGEAIVPGRLAPEGTAAGVGATLTPGKRAFGIRVHDVTSLAGMVQPNSRVDIMVVINDPKQRKPVAKLFMQNMRVLAIGRAPNAADNEAVATIEVDFDEANALATAVSQGSLQLVLRGYGDDSRGNPPGVEELKTPDHPYLRALTRDVRWLRMRSSR